MHKFVNTTTFHGKYQSKWYSRHYCAHFQSIHFVLRFNIRNNQHKNKKNHLLVSILMLWLIFRVPTCFLFYPFGSFTLIIIVFLLICELLWIEMIKKCQRLNSNSTKKQKECKMEDFWKQKIVKSEHRLCNYKMCLYRSLDFYNKFLVHSIMEQVYLSTSLAYLEALLIKKPYFSSTHWTVVF